MDIPRRNMDIRVARFEPMRVACARATSRSPEIDAWGALMAWAEPRGLVGGDTRRRIVGRDDPPPDRPDAPYGYRFMIEVDRDVEPGGGILIEDLPGHTCVVAQARGPDMIFDTWMALGGWCADHGHTIAGHGLEELLEGTPADPAGMAFDLWLPIEQPARATGD